MAGAAPEHLPERGAGWGGHARGSSLLLPGKEPARKPLRRWKSLETVSSSEFPERRLALVFPHGRPRHRGRLSGESESERFSERASERAVMKMQLCFEKCDGAAGRSWPKRPGVGGAEPGAAEEPRAWGATSGCGETAEKRGVPCSRDSAWRWKAR